MNAFLSAQSSHSGRGQRVRLSLLVSAALAAMGQPAAAQEPGDAAPAAQAPGQAASAPPDAKATGTPGVESVVVTATRRREPSRDVPNQVNAIPAQDLERAGAKAVADYLANQPGVDVKSSGGAGLTQLNVRGVSTGDQTIPTVGVYVDDVPFGSSTAYASGSGTALDLGLLDLDHLELLRGPQGTLYGAGAMGGLLKYVTREPDTGRFSGKVTLGATTTREGGVGNTVSAVLNAPLKEDVAGLRVSAFHDHQGGFVDAVGAAAGPDIDRGNTVGGRVSLLVEPASRWKVRLTGTSQKIERDSSGVVDYDASTGQPVDGELTHRINDREPYSLKTGLLSADVEYDFGRARFNSITSAQQTTFAQDTDLSSVYGPLLAGVGLDVDRVLLRANTEVHKATQEFRLTSQGNEPLQWLGGFFYDHESSTATQLVSSRMAADASPGPDLVVSDIPSKYTEYAAYGDLTWNATDRLSLTAGLRVQHNEQTFEQNSDGALLGGPATVQGSSDETSNTYLATARYALTPESNVYFRAASGYRPGGPNPLVRDPVTGQPLAPPTFQHDDLWSYEAGYKADLMDKRLGIELAAYQIRWNDMQQFYAVNAINVIVNAGKARINGAELALRYRAAAHWNADFSAAYVDGKLTEDAPGLGAAGSRLPNSAPFSASLGLSHDFELLGTPSYAGIALRHVGERNAGFDNSTTLPNYRLPSYSMIDLQGGADFGRLQLALFVRNLADQRAQVNASTNVVPLGGPVWVTPAQPRTIGAMLTATF